MMKRIAIAIVLLALPAHAANYAYDNKPEPATCTGVLRQSADGLWLVGDEEGCWFTDISFKRPTHDMLGPRAAAVVLRRCTVGKLCKISGMLKNVGYETLYWTRIDSAKPVYIDERTRS